MRVRHTQDHARSARCLYKVMLDGMRTAGDKQTVKGVCSLLNQ